MIYTWTFLGHSTEGDKSHKSHKRCKDVNLKGQMVQKVKFVSASKNNDQNFLFSHSKGPIIF